MKQASPRRYVYHLTPVQNLSSIGYYGLVPRRYIESRFGAMTVEAQRCRRPKTYLLPRLTHSVVNGFLSEWWHGSTDDVKLLRMRYTALDGVFCGEDPYNARHELWTYKTITPESIWINLYPWGQGYRWIPLKKYLWT